MTNTIENKAKFFALYWGQAIMNYNGKITVPSDFIRTTGISDCFLELTPLSQISDEDAIAVAKMMWRPESLHTAQEGRAIVENIKSNLMVSDFLRSRGYALPWMGTSVETFIEWGWVKLKGGENG